jgi:hypothetical protein
MPESQNFEARKESWRGAFLCKSFLKHVSVAMNIHTTGGDLLVLAFSNQDSKIYIKRTAKTQNQRFQG